MSQSDVASTLRVEPAVLIDAATRFATMSAIVREAQAQLSSVVASCLPLLSGSVRDAATATDRGAGQALDALATNYATLGQAMADLATRYRGVDAGAVHK